MISAIRIEPSGNVLLDADLSVLGSAWTRTLNGKIRIYRYETLAAEPDVLELDATRFPLNGVLGDDSGTYRFFKIVLE